LLALFESESISKRFGISTFHHSGVRSLVIQEEAEAVGDWEIFSPRKISSLVEEESELCPIEGHFSFAMIAQSRENISTIKLGFNREAD
jgi:hypothetical protein